MRTLIIVVGVILLALVSPWLIGLRIFVVPPTRLEPNGATWVLYGGVGLNPIDNTDAICQRTVGEVTDRCREDALLTAIDLPIRSLGCRIAQCFTIYLGAVHKGSETPTESTFQISPIITVTSSIEGC